MNEKIKKILKYTIGIGLIVLGVIGLFLPFLQGILLIVVGLMVLESKWLINKFRELKQKWKKIKSPYPTVDTIIEYKEGIVLIDRKNHPHGWAIPGGFVEYEESVEETAIREAKEETNLDVNLIRQFHVYSKPGRDHRFHTITTVFIAKGKGILKAGDDAKEAKVFKLNELPELAFDHKQILDDYAKRRY